MSQESFTENKKHRLSKSGWVAKVSDSGQSAWLDYEGEVFKRSCHVIRYDDGTFGYDWPGVVPRGVKVKIEKLLSVGENNA